LVRPTHLRQNQMYHCDSEPSQCRVHEASPRCDLHHHNSVSAPRSLKNGCVAHCSQQTGTDTFVLLFTYVFSLILELRNAKFA
jgi:hypothetical protein